MSTVTGSEFMSVAEAAEELGVCDRTVRNYAKRGLLDSCIIVLPSGVEKMKILRESVEREKAKMEAVGLAD